METFWKAVLRWRQVSLYVLNYNQTRFSKLWIIGSEAHLFLTLIGYSQVLINSIVGSRIRDFDDLR